MMDNNIIRLISLYPHLRRQLQPPSFAQFASQAVKPDGTRKTTSARLRGQAQSAYQTRPSCARREIDFSVGGGRRRNSPPSPLMIENNYLKQLSFGARANSPVPLAQSKTYSYIEILATQMDRCAGELARTPLSKLFLPVVQVVSNLKTHG